MSRSQSAAVQAFLAELAEVCRRHDLSLSHEDTEGAFRVQSFDEGNIDWLKAAFDETGGRGVTQRVYGIRSEITTCCPVCGRNEHGDDLPALNAMRVCWWLTEAAAIGVLSAFVYLYGAKGAWGLAVLYGLLSSLAGGMHTDIRRKKKQDSSMQGVLLEMELQGLTHTDTYLELKRIWFEVTGKEWN